MTYRSQFIAVSLVVGTLAAAVTASAQDAAKAQPERQAPAQHEGMTRDGRHGMIGMDPAQMSRMMENCNRMMGAPDVPAAPSAPESKQKG